MIIASFWRLCQGSNGKAARRFLLPYSVINFILSVTYVISLSVESSGLITIDPKNSRYLSMAINATFGLLVFLNDALFVRDLIFVLVSPADVYQLYRVGILYRWRARVLVVPTALYLASTSKSLLCSNNYLANWHRHSLQCSSDHQRRC
jgi:hypothetical protein